MIPIYGSNGSKRNLITSIPPQNFTQLTNAKLGIACMCSLYERNNNAAAI
jgi:hypothetical protein